MQFSLKTFTPPDFTAAVFQNAPNAALAPAPFDGCAPEGYHAMSIFPEYFKVDGAWLLAEKSRMDCVAVWENGSIYVREFRRLKAGDLVFTGRSEDGSAGIFVYPDGFSEGAADSSECFAFRQGRSRETAFSMDYDFIYELLTHERKNGHILWVLGPACAFDADARHAFSRLIKAGFVHGLLAGNALATHDLEASYKNSALGQDIYTQKIYPNGHYNHLDTINRVRFHGGIPAFIENEGITDGIMHAIATQNVPYVLAGSIRDDGPLPEVYADVYAAQNAMREQIEQATTIICMATALHTIATGNMAPSYHVLPDGTVRQVYFYTVDISEFAAGKLGDRGSLSAKSIVTNMQDFIVNVANGVLGKE